MVGVAKSKITVYTDGACIGNGTSASAGGWAFVILFENGTVEIQSAGYETRTTNNIMEMTAAVKALEKIREMNLDLPIIRVISDSRYLVKGASEWMLKWEKQGWRRKAKGKNKGEVKNLEIWKALFRLAKELKPSFQWVKGHNGNEYNEMCDDLAVTAVKMMSGYYKAVRFPKRGR